MTSAERKFIPAEAEGFTVYGGKALNEKLNPDSDSRNGENVADRAIYHISQQPPRKYIREISAPDPIREEPEVWTEDLSLESRINGRPRRMRVNHNLSQRRRKKF